jgi:outer membrane protein OmpA-like peptidoglycan-associated protein
LIVCFLLIPLVVTADETEEQFRSFLQSREVIEQVYFETASQTLSKEAKKNLDSLAPKLKKFSDGNYLFRVEGFSSPEGETSRNVDLSLYRALSVRNYLKEIHELNIDVFLTGFGSKGPVKENEDARRVDIAVYLQPEAAEALFDNQGTVDKIVIK